MPLPDHCIDCDKVAIVYIKSVPYCSKCGLFEIKEMNNDKRSSNKRKKAN